MVTDLWIKIEETEFDPKTHGNFVCEERRKTMDSEVMILG